MTSSSGPGGDMTSSSGSGGDMTSSSISGSSSGSSSGSGETAVENESADCDVAALPEASALNQIPKLPDPFTKLDGDRISTRAEWHCRRQEIRKQAEKYIYGEKPTPDVVTGTVTENKISVHVEAQGKEIDFSADIVLPSKGRAPFPAIINVGTKGGIGGITLGEGRILDQGVAVIYYNHNELGREGTPEQSRGKPNPGKFYDIYGGDHSAGLLMAWAWGASRILDVLQMSGGDIIDPTGVGVTGCSRNGKGAFAIGVLDDRIALTIPHETSTAGVPAYRIADVLGRERTDHNYYGLNWLSDNFDPFVFKNNVSNAVKLPIDTHTLIAMIAPRGLLVLENPHQAQMGAPAGHTATVAGAEVYKALGVEKNISYHSKVADKAHCSYKNEYTVLLVSNIAKFLKHEGEAAGELVVGSGGSLSMSDWVDWEAPTLK
ncbi:PE PGRS family protein [Sorangium sp. So ce1014]|uniref:glucuronyl esterase domain-containing protein n=1 Tax=Sorangium sp. So ce1014 TaxID=3133326 RepID=UPI003F62811C